MFFVYREDYNRLFQFVTEKNIRIKNKGKQVCGCWREIHGSNHKACVCLIIVSCTHTHTHKQEQTRTYTDDVSSESDHDHYLERMKAEGAEMDSEDGTLACLLIPAISLVGVVINPQLSNQPTEILCDSALWFTNARYAHTHTHTYTVQ